MRADRWMKGFPEESGMYLVELADGECCVTPWSDGSHRDTWGDKIRSGWCCLTDSRSTVKHWCKITDVKAILAGEAVMGDVTGSDPRNIRMGVASPTPPKAATPDVVERVENALWEVIKSYSTRKHARYYAEVAIAAIPAQQAGEWRPIETAPMDGTTIHLGFVNMQNFDIIAHWSGGDWSITGDGEDAIRAHGRPKPTHWRKLPQCPIFNYNTPPKGDPHAD